MPEGTLVAEREPSAGATASETETSPRRRALAIAGIFLLSTLVMWRPSPATLRTDFYDNVGDTSFTTWVLLWNSHALLSDPLSLFDANIFWPNETTLAYSESMLPLTPFFFVLHLVTGNPILSTNLLTIGLSIFCLASTYLFARRLIGRVDVAVFAALGYSFSGYVFAHTGHVHLLTLGMFPLCFLLLFRLFDERTIRVAVGLGVATAVLVASALYYGAIYGICVLTIVGGYVLSRRLRPGPRFARSLAASGVVACLLLAPVLLPYLSVREESGARVLPPEYGLNAPDFVSPFRATILYDDLAGAALTRSPGEHVYFLGFVTLVLALVGTAVLIVSSRRRGDDVQGGWALGPIRSTEIWLLVAAGIVSALIALGPEAMGFHAPFWYLRELPGFADIRATSRLVTPTLLAITVLAALGLARLTRRLRRPVAMLVTACFSVALLAELAVDPLTSQPLEYDSETLAVYRELDRRPPGAVLELPVVSNPAVNVASAFVESPRTLYSALDWNPRFNGYSGHWPPEYEAQLDVLNEFPSPEALRLADELGIRYVVLHVGPSHGFAQLSAPPDARRIVAELPATAIAERHGRAWLIDLDA